MQDVNYDDELLETTETETIVELRRYILSDSDKVPQDILPLSMYY